jgi:hypothetical protein
VVRSIFSQKFIILYNICLLLISIHLISIRNNYGINHNLTMTLTVSVISIVLINYVYIYIKNNNNDISNNNVLYIIILQSTILKFLIQFAYGTNYSLNSDVLLSESATLFLIENGLSQNLIDYNFTIASSYLSYPTQHFVLAFLTIVFQNSPLVHKYFSVLWTILTLIIFHKILKNFFSVNIANLSTLIFSLSPWFLFFHSHTNHESFTLPFVLLLIYRLLILNSETNRYKFHFYNTLILIMINTSHHFTSYLTIFIILFISIIYKNSQIKIEKCFLYTLFSHIIILYLWSSRQSNLIFRSHVNVLKLISENSSILIFSIVSLVFILLCINILIKRHYFHSYITIIKPKLQIQLLEIIGILIIITIILIIYANSNFMYFIGRTGTKPYWSSFVSLISNVTFFTLAIIYSVYYLHNLEIDSKNFKLINFILTFLFLTSLTLLSYIIENLYPIGLLRIKERFLTFTYLFGSVIISYRLNNNIENKDHLKIKRIPIKKMNLNINSNKIVNKFLPFLIIIGCMFQGLTPIFIYPELDPIYADDWRLDRKEWVDASLWLKKEFNFEQKFMLNNETSQFIFSSGRGKAYVEGISQLPVHTYGIFINNERAYNMKENFTIITSFVQYYIISLSMLELPISLHQNRTLSIYFFNFLISETNLIYSNDRILIFELINS